MTSGTVPPFDIATLPRLGLGCAPLGNLFARLSDETAVSTQERGCPRPRATRRADGITVRKLSGLITEAGRDWDVDRLRPYADLGIEAFGPDRVMWGSDWPVALLAGTYGGWLDATQAPVGRLTPDERAAILGGTAARVYGLESRGETP